MGQVLTFVWLNIADALLTLKLVSIGGEECSPWYRSLLLSPLSFTVVKMLLAVLAVLVIRRYCVNRKQSFRLANAGMTIFVLINLICLGTYLLALKGAING